MSTRVKVTTSQVLREALETLGENGERWHQGSMEGWSDTLQKSTWCIIGAIVHTRADLRLRAEAEAYLASVINCEHLDDWNDAPGRTFSEVRAAYIRAIQIAEASE